MRRSYRFGALPLQRVGCRVSVQNPLPLGIEFVIELAKVLAAYGFDRALDPSEVEPAPGINTFTVQLGPSLAGVVFGNSSGQSISIGRNVVACFWDQGNTPYENFETAVMQTYRTAIKSIGSVVDWKSFTPQISQVFYQCRVPDSDGTVVSFERDFNIQLPQYASDADRVQEVQFAFSSNRPGIDRRLTVVRQADDSFAVSTIAGTVLHGYTPEFSADGVDLIESSFMDLRESLRGSFPDLLTSDLLDKFNFTEE